ncbi:MAG: phytanoyl-CoA dioxygenase family protein [Pseudomonadales bacterium]|nr:phytanoyl-CoA dioxygenase family protein [Pseudomonadales bacterium]
MAEPQLLDSSDMARFVADGYLLMESVVPDEINRQFMDDIGYLPDDEITDPRAYYGKLMMTSSIPRVRAGTPLDHAYPASGAIANLLALPRVRGAILSLVGESPVVDHHFLHVTFPPRFYESSDKPQVSQHTHQDSTIDPRMAFDIQLMYFPHEVTVPMGGTRFVPGSHLRIVSNSAIGRYQNIKGQRHVVCPAGSLLVLHMGIWHGGGLNTSDRLRYMFKIRLCPTERQCRLWDDSDLPNDHYEQRAIFWTDPGEARDSLHAILMKPQGWYEYDTGRLELMNRVKLWRYLLGDEDFDADYWLTRVENEY